MSEAEIVRGGAGMRHEAEMAVAERLDIVQLMQRDKFVAAPDKIPVADHRLLVCDPNQLCTGIEREINARDGARVGAIIIVQSVLCVDLGSDRIFLHFFKYTPHKSTLPQINQRLRQITAPDAIAPAILRHPELRRSASGPLPGAS
jgi:hypothetical protein